MIRHKNLLTLLRTPDRTSASMSKIQLIVSGIVTTASFTFLIYALNVGWAELQSRLQDLNYWRLMIALLLYPLGFLPLIWMWHKVMCCIGGCCDFRTNMRLYSLSCLPKRIPGAIWYVSTRVVLYQERQIDFSITLIATATEVICLSFSGSLLYLLLMPMGTISPNFRLAGVAIIFGVLMLAVILWTPLTHRISRWLQQRTSGRKAIEFKCWNALQVLCISTIAWLGGGILLYILSNAVTKIPVVQLPGLIGAWSMAGTIGLAMGPFVQGLGLREVTLAVILSNYMPLPLAVTVSLLFRLLLTVGEFIWALFFALLAR